MTPAEFTAWLDHMGWSQREAARRLGCGRNTISAWLDGQAPTPIPPYIALACAALAFGLRPWGVGAGAASKEANHVSHISA